MAGTIVALAAVGGLVARLAHWWKSEHTPPSQFDRTPQLGLEFWQGDEQARMYFTQLIGWQLDNPSAVKVELDAAPVYLRLPRSQVPLEICAWTDGMFLHAVRQEISAERVTCLQQGRGMADDEYASGNLVLTDEAKNYLAGHRLRHIADEQDQAYFSQVSPFHGAARSLRDQHDPLYLLIYRDFDYDRRMDLREYEVVRLDF